MQPGILVTVLLALSCAAYFFGRRRALQVAGTAGGVRHMHSRPIYYGMLAALWSLLPALMVLAVWIAAEDQVIVGQVVADLPAGQQELSPERLNLLVNDIKNLAQGNVVSQTVDPFLRAAADHYLNLRAVSHAALSVVGLVLAMAGMGLVWRRISPRLKARNQVEGIVMGLMVAASTVAILTTVGIVLSVLFESLRFFQQVSPMDFLFGLNWSPQIALRADQVGSGGEFGAVPLFAGTLLIAGVAMLVAVPVGLLSAIYLSEYANRHLRAWAKPILEVLAGIPTVVYGFFAALVVSPLVRRAGESVGVDVSSESALAAGLVMGIMIIPVISSLSDDVLNAVPQSLRDAAYALGATQAETIRQVLLPAALPGIVGGILLAVSRAIGETMIVVMAAGLSANLTWNPLEAVTTVTVQIVTLLVGDQEFDSSKTLAAFSLGLTLFMVTLVLNVVALHVVRKYREQYE